jgi:hypothetical protein
MWKRLCRKINQMHRVTKKSITTHQRTGLRALQACQPCAAAKTKCDNSKPCARCARRDITCIRDLDPHYPLIRSIAESKELSNNGTSPNQQEASPWVKLSHTPSTMLPLSGSSLGGSEPLVLASTFTAPDQSVIQSNIAVQEATLNLQDGSFMEALYRGPSLVTQDAELLSSFPDVFLCLDDTGENSTTTHTIL